MTIHIPWTFISFALWAVPAILYGLLKEFAPEGLPGAMMLVVAGIVLTTYYALLLIYGM